MLGARVQASVRQLSAGNCGGGDRSFSGGTGARGRFAWFSGNKASAIRAAHEEPKSSASYADAHARAASLPARQVCSQ